jgi:hypothetical protein
MPTSGIFAGADRWGQIDIFEIFELSDASRLDKLPQLGSFPWYRYQSRKNFMSRNSHLPTIPTAIIPSVQRDRQSPRRVERDFQRLVRDSAKLIVNGEARKDPLSLFDYGLLPKHRIDLFETTFYLTNVRQMPELRFFVAYVVQDSQSKKRLMIYPRIFYKDLSLAWRSASHFSVSDEEIWVGKGDVREYSENDIAMIASDESTTDLPLEMQTALEGLLTWIRRPQNGNGILELILRHSPADRVEPYHDFRSPRQVAARNPDNLINGGKKIAWFSRPGDPRSLKFATGFKPDFEHGILEQATTKSRLYGGILRRFRMLSVNQTVQYYFFAGPRHVWLLPPQALTTQLSSYGVRTIDARVDEDLVIPGYEYHHYEDTPEGPVLYSQIPKGFAGKPCAEDDAKADASPWLDQLPIVEQFRQQVLKT